MQSNYGKVEIRCGTRGGVVDLCVRIDRRVPPQLRRAPSGGSAHPLAPRTPADNAMRC